MNQATLRIALYGEFGTENLGNEGTLRATIDQLRARLPHARLVAICVHPVAVTREHGIDAVAMTAPRLPESRWGGVTSVLNRVSRKLTDPIWAMWLMKDFDAVVVAGTGIVEDSGGIRAWHAPWSLLGVTLAARIRNVRLAFAGVGVSPPLSRTKKLMFRAALGMANYRSYRDDFSLATARNLGVNTSRDAVAPDLCFALLPPPKVEAQRFGSSEHLAIALGVMAYHGDDASPDSRREAAVRYLDEVTALAARLVGDGHDVRLLIGESTDVPIAESIMRRVTERANSANGTINVNHTPDLNHLMTEMDKVDAVVATRFHNLVCSLQVGVPTVAISYAPKSLALMAAVGQSEFCADIRWLDSGALRDQLDRALVGAPRIREQITGVVNRYPAMVGQEFDHLVAFLTADVHDVGSSSESREPIR